MIPENSHSISNNNREELSLKEVIHILRNFNKYLVSIWPFILVIFILGSGLGFTYAFFKKPKYTAVSTFVLEEGEKAGGLGQYAGIASLAGIDLGGGGGGIFQGDNIIELYKSRTMVQKTLLSEVTYENKKSLLVNLYIRFNKLKEKWADKEETKNVKFDITKVDSLSRLQDSILGKIVEDINKNYLSVSKPDKKLSIIQVNVTAPNEVFAQAFNTQIVNNVNDFYVLTKTKKSLQNVSILQHKTDSVRKSMNNEIYSAAAVVDATPNLNSTKLLQRSVPLQRSQFSAEANKAILGELVKNLELSKISLLKETPLIQIVDKPVYPLKEDKLSLIKGTLIGGVLTAFLLVLFLALKQILSNIIK